jgi:hypothetical protein
VETNGTTDSEELIEMLSLESGLHKFSLSVQLSVIDAQRWQKRLWHNGLEREQARTATHLAISRLEASRSRGKRQLKHRWQNARKDRDVATTMRQNPFMIMTTIAAQIISNMRITGIRRMEG